jgi:hypothetical protein
MKEEPASGKPLHYSVHDYSALGLPVDSMSVLAPSKPVSKPRPIPPDTAAKAAFVFLASCCSLAKSRRQELAAPVSDLDWSKTLEMAEHHGVTPLVYTALAQSPALVPATLWEELRNRYEQNARKNLKFTAELFRILEGPGEWAAIQLPKALFPLYRVVRICRLAGRALRTR